MIRTEDIASLMIDGEEFSAFRLGTKDGGMPNHLFQGEKKDGMIVRDGEAEKWIWTSIHYEGNDRYCYFPKLDLHSLEEIATTKRKYAHKIVMNIAKGLSLADDAWLNLETGVFPLYRIFIVGESDVLILPPDIGTVVGLLRTPDERRDEVNVLIKKGTEQNFLLIAEMAELLYFALTGSLPYIEERVRHWKYREYPLEDCLGAEGENDIDQKVIGFINVILHAKRQQMRDISGNRSAGQALSWFLKNGATLIWNAENRDTVPSAAGAASYREWSEKTDRGSKKSTFWRKKGTLITTLTIVIAGVLWLGGSWIWRALQPPVTKDLDQEEVIMALYEGQNSLNPELLSAAVKGMTLQQDMDVVNLFVNTRVRGAYEQHIPVHRADEWVAEGMPEIKQGDLIYGVDGIELERIDENTIAAYATWYGPYYGTDDENYDPMKAPEFLKIQKSEMKQTFVFEWNDRGWWNIVYSELEQLDDGEVLEVHLIPQQPEPPKIQ